MLTSAGLGGQQDHGLRAWHQGRGPGPGWRPGESVAVKPMRRQRTSQLSLLPSSLGKLLSFSGPLCSSSEMGIISCQVSFLGPWRRLKGAGEKGFINCKGLCTCEK